MNSPAAKKVAPQDARRMVYSKHRNCIGRLGGTRDGADQARGDSHAANTRLWQRCARVSQRGRQGGLCPRRPFRRALPRRLLNVGARAAWAGGDSHPLPARIAADCLYYPACGGCQTRHMSYEAELAFKQERLQEALPDWRRGHHRLPHPRRGRRSCAIGIRCSFLSARSGELCIGFLPPPQSRGD